MYNGPAAFMYNGPAAFMKNGPAAFMYDGPAAFMYNQLSESESTEHKLTVVTVWNHQFSIACILSFP